MIENLSITELEGIDGGGSCSEDHVDPFRASGCYVGVALRMMWDGFWDTF